MITTPLTLVLTGFVRTPFNVWEEDPLPTSTPFSGNCVNQPDAHAHDTLDFVNLGVKGVSSKRACYSTSLIFRALTSGLRYPKQRCSSHSAFSFVMGWPWFLTCPNIFKMSSHNFITFVFVIPEHATAHWRARHNHQPKQGLGRQGRHLVTISCEQTCAALHGRSIGYTVAFEIY